MGISLCEHIKKSCYALIFECDCPFNDSLIESGIDFLGGTLLPRCFNESESAGGSNLKYQTMPHNPEILSRDFICPSSYICTLDFGHEVMCLLFLAICRMNPAVLWIEERRVREMSLLGLNESSRSSRGIEALNASTLKGLVSAVI